MSTIVRVAGTKIGCFLSMNGEDLMFSSGETWLLTRYSAVDCHRRLVWNLERLDPRRWFRISTSCLYSISPERSTHIQAPYISSPKYRRFALFRCCVRRRRWSSLCSPCVSSRPVWKGWKLERRTRSIDEEGKVQRGETLTEPFAEHIRHLFVEITEFGRGHDCNVSEEDTRRDDCLQLELEQQWVNGLAR